MGAYSVRLDDEASELFFMAARLRGDGLQGEESSSIWTWSPVRVSASRPFRGWRRVRAPVEGGAADARVGATASKVVAAPVMSISQACSTRTAARRSRCPFGS